MISVIAASPRTAEQAEILNRQLACFGNTQIFLLGDAQAASVNDALRQVKGDRVLIIDDLSLPLGDWHRVSFAQRYGILGGIVRTYAGVRAGYGFIRNASETRTIRRLPVALHSQRAGTQNIDLPNEGCMLVRRALIERVGLLDEALPLNLALLEYALRSRECGLEIGFDPELSIDRAAGAIEPALSDEASFAGLRSERQWTQLVFGPARRAELRTVHVIAHGNRDERSLQKWLQLAGYPIAHTILTDTVHPGGTLTHELGYRERNIACIDLRAKPAQDWLLNLVEATAGEVSIGITTCSTQAEAQRIVAADATATLIVNDRIPAQICLNTTTQSFDDTLAELCVQAASLGVVTRSVALKIDRPNGWQERYFDAYSMEEILKTRKKKPSVSIVLLAGSAASVHRYTTDALRSYSGELAELLVVVRSDAPKITARLRNHPNVELLVDTEDELAGHALSRALALATGDIIVLMRDDYLVAEHWLTSMLAHLERLPQVGIVVPRLSAVKGVQNCEDELFADSVEFRLAAERRRQSRSREATLVDIVHMPAFVMRRAVLEKIGGFDEALSTSNYGVVDYCVRARTAGFAIALAEDVFVHHIPFEHTQFPHDALMGDAVYTRLFAKKWGLDAATIESHPLETLINSASAYRHQFVMLEPEREVTIRPAIRADQERVVLLLPLLDEDAWQQAGNVVRKYLMTFTADDPVTLAIGRQDSLRTSVVAQRIRKMIAESKLDDAVIPDIVISDAQARQSWLSSLPTGPRYLLTSDAELPAITVWEDLSPSGLRRAVTQFEQNPV